MSEHIDTTAPFLILPRDTNADLWLRLQKYLQARLDTHRRKNDGNLTPEDTAVLRGRIAELKWLLSSVPAPDDQH